MSEAECVKLFVLQHVPKRMRRMTKCTPIKVNDALRDIRRTNRRLIRKDRSKWRKGIVGTREGDEGLLTEIEVTQTHW